MVEISVSLVVMLFYFGHPADTEARDGYAGAGIRSHAGRGRLGLVGAAYGLVVLAGVRENSEVLLR